jgi:hypothetical protein
MRGKHWVMALTAAGLALGWSLHSARAQENELKTRPGTAGAPEVRRLLSHLEVDAPRRYKNMVVFPIRYTEKQAPGDWETMAQALEGGRLKVRELPDASVPEVEVENVGDKTVFLLSGEIIAGGKQTRTIRKDTVVEPKQVVKVPVFCVEQRRWKGSREFVSSPNYLPSRLNNAIKRGASQGQVWGEVEERSAAIQAPSATSSLDEVLNSEKAQREFEEVHKGLGKFSPPETIGIAVADARTGKVIGIELFGRRDLFEALQEKLMEGYAADLVLAQTDGTDAKLMEVDQKAVREFIGRLLSLGCGYEDTPGSGRGIDLAGGTLHGKGVVLGEHVIHLSVQEMAVSIEPVKPIVIERMPNGEVRRQR